MLKNNESIRIDYLDSVRGLAALTVLVFHVLSSHWDWWLPTKCIVIIFNGIDAVGMFFVLSGLVLSLKIFQSDLKITPKFYCKFAVTRIFRLYPAFFAMLIIYYFYAHHQENYFDLIKATFVSNPYHFWEEAMLIRDNHILFLPDWTLGIEVAISLLVPFMAIIAKEGNKLFLCLILISIFISDIYISEFFYLFGLGILIAKNFTSILSYNDTSKWWYKYRWHLLPIILFLYSIRHIFVLFPINPTIRYVIENILSISEFTITGTAAALIIVYIINTPLLKKILSNKLLIFLGKISYGIYLSHWLFTKIVMNNFDLFKHEFAHGSEFNLLIIYMLFTLISSICAGTLLYYCVELPMIKFARKRFS